MLFIELLFIDSNTIQIDLKKSISWNGLNSIRKFRVVIIFYSMETKSRDFVQMIFYFVSVQAS